MSNEVAVTKEQSPAVVFRQQLEKQAPEFQAALPEHIPVERFKRIVLTAVSRDPDLLAADRRSLFEACTLAAQDGLLPDGREAAFVIFNTKDKTGGWTRRAQYMPMISGVLKKVRNSGELAGITSNVVYDHDDFDYELGDNEKIYHKPSLGANRGMPIGAYAIAHLKNGMVEREFMTTAEIEQVRQVSRAKESGPWKSWWGEMARKTVLRRLSKRLPMSSDLDTLMRRDDALYDMDQRPQRADYMPPQLAQREQAETRQAEADERRMDDEYRAITTDRMPDDTPDQGRADEGNEAPAETATPVSTPGPAPKEPGDKRADSAGQLPLDQAEGATRVPLVDENGQEIGSYERADHYFNALKKKAVESSDPEAFLHANQAGANVFVQRDEGYIARWNECQEAAYEAQDAMNATA